MASLTAACRISARALHCRAATRSFSASSRRLAAQNFIMPALSPTMTEGNIAAWKVKEGESFSAGDVLLEIETDKATMDVEAQDDGILMKIMSGDGAKAVQVGTRIAVLAEAGDDISALQTPPEEFAAATSSQQADSSSSTTSNTSTPSTSTSTAPKTTTGGSGTYEHRHPLLPSVGQLIKQNAISREDLSKIRGTGPNGRLLKGDVLAFLGTVDAGRPEAISAHLEQLSHLDLSNIKVAAKKEPPPSAIPHAEEAVTRKVEQPATVTVQVQLSMASALDLQQSIQDKIGVPIDLLQLVDRAARIANRTLGPSSRPPSADELFDQILGRGRNTNTIKARDYYQPIISSVDPPQARSAPKPDIIDILAGPRKVARTRQARIDEGYDLSVFATDRVLSLVVPKEDRKRAQGFLEHCKTILEVCPQRLLEL